MLFSTKRQDGRAGLNRRLTNRSTNIDENEARSHASEPFRSEGVLI